jgi:hypothetical protein
MVRIFFTTIFIITSVAAFHVGISRRDAILQGGSAVLTSIVVAPQVSNAFSQQLEDNAPVDSAQMATNGKIDLNSAFVVCTCV